MNSSAETLGWIGTGRQRQPPAIAFWIGMLGRPDHHRAQAEGEGEQIAQRDRPFRRHGVVDRAFEAFQHAPVGKLGQQSVDGIVEAQLALLDQDHRRGRRHRLGHGGDAEDRVAPHRRVAFQRLAARAPRHASRRGGSPARRCRARRSATHGPPAHRASAPIASWTRRPSSLNFPAEVVVKRSRQRAQPPSWMSARLLGRQAAMAQRQHGASAAIGEGHRHQRLAIDDAAAFARM